MADGFNPIRRFPPSPAQAGRAAPTSLERGSVDPVVVLVDCSGCRSRRESPGPSQPPRRVTAAGSVGSSLPASCSGSERVTEAGARRQSRGYGGGLSMILRLRGAARAAARRRARARAARAVQQGREHSSREGVLVSAKRLSLTRRQRRRCLAVSPGRSDRKGGSTRARSRQRASEATSQARLAVDNAAVGRCSAEEHSIEAPPGPRGITLIVAIGATRTCTTETGCGKAEAGGSPSSEASPGGSPEAIGRGWVRVVVALLPARDRRTKEGAPGNRAICGVLGSEVGCRSRRDASFSRPSSRHGVTRGRARSRDSLKRPAIL